MAKKNDPDKLTPMQELFCRNLLQCDFNQTQAAEDAGYSKKTSAQQASRLLTLVKIQDRVNELIEDKLNLSRGQLRYKVLNELNSIAFHDVTKDINIETVEEEVPIYDKEGNDTGETRTLCRQRVIVNDTSQSEQSRAIASIKQNEKGVIELKYYDKIAALEKLGKFGGLWSDKLDVNLNGKVQNTNANIDYSTLSDEESKNLFMDLIGKDE